ncbi:hypothetical protein K461DRAFT_286523 [Myriangium duriaei CBS 260.36]|uniref:E3 ubiquitin-protein ligase n=1 Tax=Myriangium duriaei CBS 260.36 TaxID=1168546 RepID=A0A9P4IZE3_9PEZI|nr:hypothetical protein K461DRAFT_286523 [Myriangium duriaei CBS 260.36]
MLAVDTEAALSRCLRDLPHLYNYRYTADAERHLRKTLCTSLILNHSSNLPLLFRSASPDDPHISWNVSKAQGGQEGAEYTEAARGHPCGHIFKPGESSYHCKTCAADDTCVLCARCFAESDHEGHTVFVSVSPGNSGCCDCGDEEAWTRPVHCSIHDATHRSHASSGKAPQPAGLPLELTEAIRRTIGKALDYMCDVFSCSPEQLRLAKNEGTVMEDERNSRLNPEKYGGAESIREPVEFCLVLWNDEKHTLDQVQLQVARACRKTKGFGMEKAEQVDSVGRSIVDFSTDVHRLLKMASVLEQIKVSVTLRSSRDTFREQMCETIIAWLADISGCSVGPDNHILRNTVCSEMFSEWQVGSPKANEIVGAAGIYDHETGDREWADFAPRIMEIIAGGGNTTARLTLVNRALDYDMDEDEDLNDDTNDDDGDDERETESDLMTLVDRDATALADANTRPRRQRLPNIRINTDLMDLEDDDGTLMAFPGTGDVDVDMGEAADEDPGEVLEATMAGYPPPPPPPTGPLSLDASRQGSMSEHHDHGVSQESDEADTAPGQSSKNLPTLPKTPQARRFRNRNGPEKFWTAKPAGWVNPEDSPLTENLSLRLRIDYLILYDLRLWKTLRDSLRYTYISAVITVPEYKRLLGIRFAGLYTLLAQLYLIADREPDHSIINLSLQLLTTPSITHEVIEKANFLTHLLAIIYTFLTTRQVGYPKDVSPNATLAFDAGAITNRRMFHFFVDARYMFQATSVQERMRTEPQFLLQFLDLVKLHQGICPNVRAIGEHVEYETDTWLSASMITKEINKLSRLVTDAFLTLDVEDPQERAQLGTATMILSHEVALSSLGLEWARFTSSEMKGPLKFKNVGKTGGVPIIIPDISVSETHMSFHHPLHYILSWVLQAGKSLSREQVQSNFFMMSYSKHPDASFKNKVLSGPVKPHDWIAGMFDPPLRVCVWLAQLRAGMWVRNGMTLRHQMHSYRNPAQRDVTYQRDIFMLQAGLILCDPGSENIGEKFFLQIVHRFDLQGWLEGKFKSLDTYDCQQYMDVIEDFFHLLVILLSERDDLLPLSDHGKPSLRAIERDIAHALCFKALSYSDLASRLTERISESEKFDEILENMTNYKAPEGLNDSGTFELKSTFIDTIDPYYAFYSRNQREEADTIYREHFAKKQGVDKAEVVPEPVLLPIEHGLFKHLSDFVRTESFACFMSYALKFALEGYKVTGAESSRIEPILQIMLHLVLITVGEDTAAGILEGSPLPGFIDRLFTPQQTGETMLDGLKAILGVEDFAACHPRVRLVIKRAQQTRPVLFAQHNALDPEPRSTATPSQNGADKEAKKRAALERQAKVMAQFKAQQSTFMTAQGLDWDIDDISDDENKDHMDDVTGDLPETENVREYPADACILCQEDSNEERLYGCFAFIAASNIQRQTPTHDPDFVQEVVDTPASLDRSAEGLRPFGVSSQNKREVEKLAADGSVIRQQVQVLSKAFNDRELVLKDHVITSCGHMMHFSCFETYMAATLRRQSHQISRNHPERVERKEFLCPLCKALGNIFLPVIWKSRKEHYPGVLGSASQTFDDWLPLATGLPGALRSSESRSIIAREYIQNSFQGSISENVLREAPPSPTSGGERFRAARALASVLSVRIPDIFAGSPSSPTSSTDELTRAYQLLNSSVHTNAQGPPKDPRTPVSPTSPSPMSPTSPVSPIDPNPPVALGPILQTVSSSIAAVEIHNRGVESQHSLLTSISEQTLSSLRIFCETASSIVATEQIKDARMAGITRTQEYHCLSHLLGLPDSDQHIRNPSPLLHNVFWSLTACSFLAGNDWLKHGHNLIQLALLAEMTKAVFVYKVALGRLGRNLDVQSESEDAVFTAFCQRLDQLHSDASTAAGMLPPQTGTITPAALIFLRKVTILAHVRSAVDFSAASASLDPELPELDRLAVLLRLPSLTTIFQSFVSDTASAEAQRRLVKRWLLNTNSEVARPITLDHPAIFELVGLPKTFDALTEEAVKRRCPTTGKTMADPIVCLFCGEIFCSQTACCRVLAPEDSKPIGGAQQHLVKCGGPVGIFINIRKCMVLFIHNRNGSWAQAPYLDKHGEADPALRRHHQLFLNQRRYDRLLREVWLSHGVPNVISRKLEGDINNGGWETL